MKSLHLGLAFVLYLALYLLQGTATAQTPKPYFYEPSVIRTYLIDNDGDGYASKFQIKFDADISPGWTADVYAILTIRSVGGEWEILGTTSNFRISGDASSDAQIVTVDLAPSRLTGRYDIGIALLRVGSTVVEDLVQGPNLAALAGLLLEGTSFDIAQIVSIREATTSRDLDSNFNSYHQRFSVSFDADVTVGSANVYAKLYLRIEGGQWALYHTTPIFTITGTASGDARSVTTTLPGNFQAGRYDVLIEILKAGETSWTTRRGPEDDLDLDNLLLEGVDLDTPQSFSIANANRVLTVDEDGDGYFQRATITIDANVSSGSATVVAKFYARRGTGPWESILISTPFQITGNATSDAQMFTFDMDRELAPGLHRVHLIMIESIKIQTAGSFGDVPEYLEPVPGDRVFRISGSASVVLN